MKLLVLDNIGSFSLLPYFKNHFKTGNIFSMANIYEKGMWQIFKNVAPDIVFVDFCNENAVILSERINELPNKPKVIIRLHGYEAQSWYIDKIKWQNINALIVVSPKFKEIVLEKKVIDESKIHVIFNGIDFNKFKLQKESEMDINSIAYLGYLNKKKGPTLLRTVIASMPNKQFHIGGIYQDEHVRLYFDNFKLENVKFYGWVKSEEFLKGKRFILSTSVTESFGMSIAEGMAMGLTPLVHEWPGVEYLWPKDYTWTTFQSLVYLSKRPLDPKQCREWVENRYSMDSCIDRILKLFRSI